MDCRLNGVSGSRVLVVNMDGERDMVPVPCSGKFESPDRQTWKYRTYASSKATLRRGNGKYTVIFAHTESHQGTLSEALGIFGSTRCSTHICLALPIRAFVRVHIQSSDWWVMILDCRSEGHSVFKYKSLVDLHHALSLLPTSRLVQPSSYFS